mmetsp:Transcript_1442/g.4923  ORF Transcript_1442/g.4923 Transcript_1442/m.4923 type:complete len:81 (+) Transcript_1442:387-629(+)
MTDIRHAERINSFSCATCPPLSFHSLVFPLILVLEVVYHDDFQGAKCLHRTCQREGKKLVVVLLVTKSKDVDLSEAIRSL